jgi:triosephosphate isomerase (TIM)
MRKKIVAGNWKMNLLATEVEAFIAQSAHQSGEVSVMIAPSALYLERMLSLKPKGFWIAAQDVSVYEKGAYTGECSALQLQSMGVEGAIVGHSERRTYHHEDDVIIGKKVLACLSAGITPVYCCGETLSERESGQHFAIVENQVLTALRDRTAEEMLNIIIAYEPVWAIGTGVTASNEQAEEMHVWIRSCIEKQWGEQVASQMPILYGGSVNPANAAALFACPNVDGGLVGGASLKNADFEAIIQAAKP